MCYACVMTKCQHLRLCCFVLSFCCLRCTMGLFLSSYLRWEMEETPQYYLGLEEDRWMWRWNEEMWVWEEVRFYFFCVATFFRRVFWMQVWDLVWVGDGFEPEFVGEGWWLEKNLADWRWPSTSNCQEPKSHTLHQQLHSTSLRQPPRHTSHHRRNLPPLHETHLQFPIPSHHPFPPPAGFGHEASLPHAHASPWPPHQRPPHQRPNHRQLHQQPPSSHPFLKGRIGRSGFGIGAALRGVLVFGFGQDIYDLETMVENVAIQQATPQGAVQLRSLFLLLLLFSLSLLLFRREVVCWAATDCPDVEGEILI